MKLRSIALVLGFLGATAFAVHHCSSTTRNFKNAVEELAIAEYQGRPTKDLQHRVFSLGADMGVHFNKGPEREYRDLLENKFVFHKVETSDNLDISSYYFGQVDKIDIVDDLFVTFFRPSIPTYEEFCGKKPLLAIKTPYSIDINFSAAEDAYRELKNRVKGIENEEGEMNFCELTDYRLYESLGFPKKNNYVNELIDVVITHEMEHHKSGKDEVKAHLAEMIESPSLISARDFFCSTPYDEHHGALAKIKFLFEENNFREDVLRAKLLLYDNDTFLEELSAAAKQIYDVYSQNN